MGSDASQRANHDAARRSAGAIRQCSQHPPRPSRDFQLRSEPWIKLPPFPSLTTLRASPPIWRSPIYLWMAAARYSCLLEAPCKLPARPFVAARPARRVALVVAAAEQQPQAKKKKPANPLNAYT